MPQIARHLALAACLTLVGSVADAAPKRRAAKVKKAPVEEVIDATDDEIEDEAEEDDDEEEAEPVRKQKQKQKASKHRVGFKSEEPGDEAELVDAPKVRKPKGLRSWHFAIGPNVWMASVDAKVAVGEKDVGAAIDFFDLQRHTKLGVPILLEGRYKRFSFTGDFLYGVVALQGGNDVGPLMVTLDGNVSSLLVDGIAGYRLLGSDQSKLSVEARAGVRYQRTAISGSLGLSGNGYDAPAIIDAGADMLAGARVEVRPVPRFYLAGTVDQSLFGSSSSTWSLGVDANIRVSRVLFTAGWRTLTQQKDSLSTVMHGPRAAVQILF
jgi:hypothetical protein